MGDIGKRPTVNKYGVALKCLHQIRLDRILQQSAHCVHCPELIYSHRPAVHVIRHDDPAKPHSQVRHIFSQTQHRHHFRSSRNKEAVFAHDSVVVADANYDLAQ
ncbi:hypothetical protein D1872_239020 [compost metagenome]